MAKPTVLVKDKLYAPIEIVNYKAVKQKFTHTVYDEPTCGRCPYLPERHCIECDPCPAYVGTVKTYSTREYGGETYVGLPLGQKEVFLDIMHIDDWGDVTIIDKRHKTAFDYDITFGGIENGALRDYQEEIVTKFLKEKYGLIVAPPRSGKCCHFSTIVFTERGIMPIGDLFDKDQKDDTFEPLNLRVKTAKGMRVADLKYTDTVEQTIRVTTKRGYTIQGTPEHPLLVMNSSLNLRWKSLDKLKIGDCLTLDRNIDTWSDTNFVISDGKRSKEITADLARLCGYLVANGNLHCVSYTNCSRFGFCTANTKVIRDFSNVVFKLFGHKCKWVTHGSTLETYILSKKIVNLLKHIGLKFTIAAGKEIPFSILRSKREIVTAFFEAYFSCDSHYGSNNVELMSASKKLATQIHVVLLNYGIASSLSTKISFARNTINKTKRPYYRIAVTGADYNKFLDTFNVLKPQGHKLDYILTTCDTIPYLGANLKRVFNKHHTGSGNYLVDGVSRHLKPMFDWKTKKLGVNNLDDDLRTNHLNNINFETLSILGEHELIGKIQSIASNNFLYDSIVDIVVINKPTKVYDISVPQGRNFVANGIISHNTIMALAIGIKLKMRMLVIANQNEFLDQFIDHVQRFSNLPELQEKHGKKLFGVAKKEADFEDFQIAATTYQRFLSESGQKLLKRIAPYYGTVWVDECFVYDTLVMTSVGLMKIGDIGEDFVTDAYVLSYCVESGIVEYQSIESFTKKSTQTLCRVELDCGTLVCTPNHKLYVRNVGWVQAQHLKEGDDVLEAVLCEQDSKFCN